MSTPHDHPPDPPAARNEEVQATRHLRVPLPSMTLETPSAIVSAMDVELDSGPRRVELAARENDGVFVTLLWAPATNLLAVVVVDSKRYESFELVVEPADGPLEVFYHPYAAAAARGLDLVGNPSEAELPVEAGS